MAAKIDDATCQFALGIPGGEHYDLGIDRACWFENVWVILAGVGHGHAVFHAETAVEGDLVFQTLADCGCGDG